MDITNETKMAATGLGIFLPIALNSKTEKVAALITLLEQDYGFYVYAVAAEDLRDHDSDWSEQAKAAADGKPVIALYDGYADTDMAGAVNVTILLDQASKYGFHPVVAVGPYGMDSALGNRFLHINF